MFLYFLPLTFYFKVFFLFWVRWLWSRPKSSCLNLFIPDSQKGIVQILQQRVCVRTLYATREGKQALEVCRLWNGIKHVIQAPHLHGGVDYVWREREGGVGLLHRKRDKKRERE